MHLRLFAETALLLWGKHKHSGYFLPITPYLNLQILDADNSPNFRSLFWWRIPPFRLEFWRRLWWTWIDPWKWGRKPWQNVLFWGFKNLGTERGCNIPSRVYSSCSSLLGGSTELTYVNSLKFLPTVWNLRQLHLWTRKRNQENHAFSVVKTVKAFLQFTLSSRKRQKPFTRTIPSMPFG